jgi:hypothetical protein
VWAEHVQRQPAQVMKNQILFAACSVMGPPGTPVDPASPSQRFVILSAKDGKILERLPLAGSSDGAAFNPATMEAFSTQGNGTMTIVKEKSPTSFEVEQDLKTWPSNGARTIAFDNKTGHLFAMASEVGPRRRDPGLLHDHHGRQIGLEPVYFPITSTENESVSSGPRPRPPAGAGPNSAAATKTRWFVGSSPRLRENCGVLMVCVTWY